MASSRLTVSDCYDLEEKNLVAKGRYAEIYECPCRFKSVPEDSLSFEKGATGPKLQSRAIKLVRKQDYASSVENHEERPCTLLREIVLLWRANYKGIESQEDSKFEKPFMKIFGVLETRYYCFPFSRRISI